MKSLDELLLSLGINDSQNRAVLKQDIELYAVEAAILKIENQQLLHEGERELIDQLYREGRLDIATFERLFGNDHREKILEESLAEAISITIGAVGVQAA